MNASNTMYITKMAAELYIAATEHIFYNLNYLNSLTKEIFLGFIKVIC